MKKNIKTRWPFAVLAILSAPILVPLIILVLLVLAIFVPLSYLLVYLSIWSAWGLRGKDVLFVYSDSPIWHDYMLSEMLPLVRGRAVVLNWSERSGWKYWSFRS